MLGTHGDRAVRVLYLPYLLGDTGYSFKMVICEKPVTLTPIAERLAVDLSLPVLSRLGFEHQTFRMRGERSKMYKYISHKEIT